MESAHTEGEEVAEYWRLIQEVAVRAVERERDLGRRYYVADFALDIAQELFLKLRGELAAFDPSRGVPLAAYLRQRLKWHAQKIIRNERRWRRITDRFDPNKTVRSGESHGSRVIGPEKVPIRVEMTPSRDHTHEALDAALRSLDALEWKMIEGRTLGIGQAEIAAAFGISQSQVSRRIESAQKKMREAMHKRDGSPTYTKRKETPGKLIPQSKNQGTDKMQLLTLAEVARRLGLSEKTARKVVKPLPTVKVGKRLRYSTAVIDQFIVYGGNIPTERLTA